MTRAYHTLALAIAVLACPVVSAAQEQAVDPAKAIFESMAALERAFDPKVADLYCDSGMIFLIQVSPGGGRHSIDIPARAFKDVIRSNIRMGKASGDYSTYSNASYVKEGRNVRVTATRYSVKDKVSNAHTMLIGPCDGGGWKILEERAEIRVRRY
jgi:hypothetical protein